LRYGRHLDLILTDQHSFCGDDPTDAEGVVKIYDHLTVPEQRARRFCRAVIGDNGRVEGLISPTLGVSLLG
jgi:hypothetical protein